MVRHIGSYLVTAVVSLTLGLTSMGWFRTAETVNDLVATNSSLVQDLASSQQQEREAKVTIGQLKQSSAEDFNRRRTVESKLNSIQKELEATKAELQQARQTVEWFAGFVFEPEIVPPFLVKFDRYLDDYDHGLPVDLRKKAGLLEYVVQVARDNIDLRDEVVVQIAPRMIRLAQYVDPDQVIIGGYTLINWLKDLPKEG